jgi:hypothetical protein
LNFDWKYISIQYTDAGAIIRQHNAYIFNTCI